MFQSDMEYMVMDETAVKEYISGKNEPSWEKGVRKGLEYLNI